VLLGRAEGVKAHSCCAVAAIRSTAAKSGARLGNNGSCSKARLRRLVAFSKWIVPGAILALLPKCPVCLAAYLALGTGIGISVSSAVYLRAALVALCLLSLLYLAASSGRHSIAKILQR
jgi:hypothetical protein